MSTGKALSKDQTETLIETLQARFEKNMSRHKGINWSDVLSRIENNPDKLWSLHHMEITGGEPDVISLDKTSGNFVFCDCSPESPTGRRSICYDQQALDARKANKPKDSAIGMASAMGITILNEEEYRDLQRLGKFDLKTSSWIDTPPAIRKLGGALFCDRRYDTVFTYHNGADSYYAARGFRGLLRV